MTATTAHRSFLTAAGDWLLGLFTRNLGAKSAALILAVIVWFTVHQDLTRSREVDAHVSIPELAAERLMTIDAPPPKVKVTFSGPASKIEEISKAGIARLRLRVRAEDLLGKSRATIEFSLESGNILHPYGDEVQITGLEPERILLTIAKRGQREMPVRKPKVVGDLKEWSAEVLSYTRKIEVTGPEDRLATLTEIEPEPIRADRVLGENREEDRIADEGTLDLAEFHRRELIQPARNERISYQAEFRRSRLTEEFDVPFSILFPEQDSKVTLQIQPTDVVKASTGGFTIRLTFTGSRADLDRIRDGIASTPPAVRAWVHAGDCDGYVNENPAFAGWPGKVRVDMPEDLMRRVAFQQPDRSSIEVRTKPR